MVKINYKSLVIGILLGFLFWLIGFVVVGSARYDFIANKPVPFNFGMYGAMLILTFIITLIILVVYLWKYEQNNPIIPDKWAVDALIFGTILCGMNVLFDIIFFGIFLGINLITYFFFQSTTGYIYPLIILETVILAYLIYGKNE
ncbi:MAG: hypothetical protein GF383_15515 [Candidatus Lokiarchaeota archaeon]|nr:hypothetical protein [Candidatus Lokiarchaeota archaeon]MBD3342969.1 hypothetical protein [Candidatus Lokiarchaeota archaeon]